MLFGALGLIALNSCPLGLGFGCLLVEFLFGTFFGYFGPGIVLVLYSRSAYKFSSNTRQNKEKSTTAPSL